MSAGASGRWRVHGLRAGLIVLIAACAVFVARPDYLFMPHRFRVVDERGMYRGGQPSLDQFQRMSSKYGVHTVVSLVDDKSAEGRTERQAAETCGLRFFSFPMPGNGTGDFDALDAAADQIADPKNYPIYFHCAAGKNRSNAAQAAWRMRHCGWTIEQALSEIEGFGLDRREDAQLVDHLRKYYDERVRPGRAATQSAANGP